MKKQKIEEKIKKISQDIYPCENPWERKICPRIGLAFRNSIKKMLREKGTLVTDIRGYNFYSAFVKMHNYDGYIYINIDYGVGHDLKPKLGLRNVLYRTAKNIQDYHGGTNHFCDFEELVEKLQELEREA